MKTKKITGTCGVFEQNEQGLYLQVHLPSSGRPRVGIEELVFEINDWGLQNTDNLALEEAVKLPGRKVLIAPSQDKKTFLKKTIIVEKPQESYLECNIMGDGIYARLCPIDNKSLDLNKALNQIKAQGIENFSLEAIKDCLHKEGFWIKIAPKPEEQNLKNGELLIKLSEDKMRGEISVFPPLGGDAANYEDIKSNLLRQGITYGWEEEELQVLCDVGKEKKATLIIKGEMPSAGEEAKIEYLFEPSVKLKPKELEDGRVDHHELGTIIKVHKGDILAKKNPAFCGTKGITLTGEETTGLYGKDIAFPQGKGTSVSDDGWSLLAAIDGSVSTIGNKICVLPICEVKDIDFSVGNIDFPGSVKITGSVKSGFKVKAAGNVEIYGNVEDAEIHCGGKLNVRGGIFGRGNCKISAEDDITCRFIINANVSSSSNIKVQDEIMHSHTSANKKIFTTGRKGIIAGGNAIAGDEIITRIIGSQYATPTEVEVGVVPHVRKELKEVEKNIEIYRNNLVLLKQAILKLEGEQKKTDLPKQKKHTLIKLIRQQYNVMDSLNKSQARKNQLDEVIEGTQNAKITVQDMLYSGVKIIIKKALLKITEDTKHTIFYEEDGEIKMKFQKVAKKSAK